MLTLFTNILSISCPQTQTEDSYIEVGNEIRYQSLGPKSRFESIGSRIYFSLNSSCFIFKVYIFIKPFQKLLSSCNFNIKLVRQVLVDKDDFRCLEEEVISFNQKSYTLGWEEKSRAVPGHNCYLFSAEVKKNEDFKPPFKNLQNLFKQKIKIHEYNNKPIVFFFRLCFFFFDTKKTCQNVNIVTDKFIFTEDDKGYLFLSPFNAPNYQNIIYP
ncbi:hypothetical protein CDIK_1323 [Cucumispora dikerogammari]|nr:hypothetical protein CDIK_1323 [Cucumispora dikerogammari]